MRTTLLATASSALAAAALLAGAGTAGADEAETDGPVCIVVDTFTGAKRTMCLTPEEADAVSSLGYGSAGTGSLADLLSLIINTGSTTLSVGVPNSTGSYAPGSFGSYGPEAAVGEILTGSIGSLGEAF